MSATTDFERTLATWLERDGPADVPERVVTAALAEARTVRQRRAWLTRAWWTTRASRGAGFMGSTRSIDDLARPLRLVWIVALIGLLLAATALVALVGSELLRRSDDRSVVVPVPASPSPAPTEGPLPGMVAVEVEPGVFRVTSDGVRDLTKVEAVDIVAGYDGGIWLLSADEFLRLGSEGSHGWPTGSGPEDRDFAVAPDGTMWVIPGPYPITSRGGAGASGFPGAGQRSTDGEAWAVEPYPGTGCAGFTIAPDGTVWASWRLPAFYGTVRDPGLGSGLDPEWRVGHLGPTGWQPLDGYAREDPWFNNPEGFSRKGYRQLFITDTGDLYGYNLLNEGLFRYEGRDWESFSPTGLSVVDVGPDGTIWYGGDEDDVALHRFADGEWATWTRDDLPDIGILYPWNWDVDDQFAVAPDGSLWFSERRSCDGLVRFDGRTSERFLPGRCISMDIAADGWVWVLASEETLRSPGPGGREWVLASDPRTGHPVVSDLYLITPEAMAASG